MSFRFIRIDHIGGAPRMCGMVRRTMMPLVLMAIWLNPGICLATDASTAQLRVDLAMFSDPDCKYPLIEDGKPFVVNMDTGKACFAFSYTDGAGEVVPTSHANFRCSPTGLIYDKYPFSENCQQSQTRGVEPTMGYKVGRKCQFAPSHAGGVYEKLVGYRYPGNVDCRVGTRSADALERATIWGIREPGFPENGRVQLVDGRWQGAPIAPGAARPGVMLLPSYSQTADLDRDGLSELIALFAASSGAGGERLYLATFGQPDETPQLRSLIFVGDRVEPRDLRVDAQLIILDVVETGPGEPACCGTQLAQYRYQYETAGIKELDHVVQAPE